MQWKTVMLEVLVVTAIVSIGLVFIIPAAIQQPEQTENVLSAQMGALESRMDKLEKTLSERQMEGSHPQQSSNANTKEADQKLRKIMERLALLEKRSEKRPPQVPPFSELPPPPSNPSAIPGAFSTSPMPPRGKDPLGWMKALPDEKRDKVEDIMKYQAQALRDKLPPLSTTDGLGPNPEAKMETIKELVEQNRQELMENLKKVLSSDEYQQYLDSQPGPASQVSGPRS